MEVICALGADQTHNEVANFAHRFIVSRKFCASGTPLTNTFTG
jgi:hypothetical protein